MRHLLRIFQVLVFLGIVFPRVAPAESEASVQTPPAGIVVSRTDELEGLYNQAIEFFHAGEFAHGADALDRLTMRASSFGYFNLPSYSLRLIEYAKNFASRSKNEEAAFLLRRATELSPHSARVWYSAAMLSDAIGYWESLKNLGTAISVMHLSPGFVLAIVGSMLIVVLVASTLSLIALAVIQFICNGKLILTTMANIAPLRLRGIAGPLLFALVLLGPLAFGILGMLVVWCLVLSRYVKGCKLLGVFAGLLCVAWALSISIIDTLSAQLASPVNSAIEYSNSKSLDSEAPALLAQEIKANPVDSLVIFAMGQIALADGNLSQAEFYFNEVLKIERSEAGLQDIIANALINLGVAKFLAGDFENAKKYFEEAKESGINAIELTYNLAQAHLGLLDTVGYRTYYTQALSMDSEWVNRYEQLFSTSRNETPLAVSISAPLYMSYARYFTAVPFSISGIPSTAKRKIRNDVAAALLNNGSINIALLCGFATVLLGLLNCRKGRRHSDRVLYPLSERSKMWCCLPMGPVLSSPHPGVGMLLVIFVVSLVLFALGQPVRFISDSAVPSLVKNAMLGISLIMVGFLALVSLLRAKTEYVSQ